MKSERKKSRIRVTVICIFILVLLLVGAFILGTFFPNIRLISSMIEITSPLIGVKVQQNYSPNLPPAIDKPVSELQEIKKINDEIKKNKIENVALNKPVDFIGQLVEPISKDKQSEENIVVLPTINHYLRYSVNNSYYASNLTDGDRDSIAYPASWFLDYIIDLKNVFEIKKVVLVWKNFGTDQKYITSWKLYSQTDFNSDHEPNIETDWTLVREGNLPNTLASSFDVKISARRFRLRAESFNRNKRELINWIGVAEFEAYTTRVN